MNDNSLFYCEESIKNDDNEKLINEFEKFSRDNGKQVYITNRILGSKQKYEYENVLLVMIPRYKIIMIDFDNDKEKLEDLKEDLGAVSSKHDYNIILGRIRKLAHCFEHYNFSNFSFSDFISNEIDVSHHREIDLLISLLIGSINDITKFTEVEPDNILDKIKQKIILFDANQSDFIFEKHNESNDIIIQGMAGTGKTELLLYKMKELFETEENVKIGYSCLNIVLAKDIKKRIIDFFNFMKVDKQVEFGKDISIFHSWGSKVNKDNVGLYSYITNFYKISYYRYNYNITFEMVCKEALKELASLSDFTPCFDYLMIDESQDFGPNFFELCKKVTSKKVYIAGDIFQNIFDRNLTDSIKVDYILDKCYRTEPKTLMFAHAVGMGLYESKKINWLSQNDWEKCGYDFTKIDDKKIELTRKPLKRFEDIELESNLVMYTAENSDCVNSIINVIESIKSRYATVCPHDIGIIIIDDFDFVVETSNALEFLIKENFDWNVSKGFETKNKEINKVYISNINNVKGLEFPFVICVYMGKISNNIFFRNKLYTSLTRSFLESHFILNKSNEEFFNTYNEAASQIQNDNKMIIEVPTKEEEVEIEKNIEYNIENQQKNKSLDSLINDSINKFKKSTNYETRKSIVNLFKELHPNIDSEDIDEKVENLLKGSE